MVKVQTKETLKVTMPARIKRQLKDIAEDKGVTMNDIALHAIQDHIAKQNATYQEPDLVVDRLNQVLNALMAQTQVINQLIHEVDELRNEL